MLLGILICRLWVTLWAAFIFVRRMKINKNINECRFFFGFVNLALISILYRLSWVQSCRKHIAVFRIQYHNFRIYICVWQCMSNKPSVVHQDPVTARTRTCVNEFIVFELRYVTSFHVPGYGWNEYFIRKMTRSWLTHLWRPERGHLLLQRYILVLQVSYIHQQPLFSLACLAELRPQRRALRLARHLVVSEFRALG